MTDGLAAFAHGMMHVAMVKEAVASTALSHADDCVCVICRADRGDADAFAEVLAFVSEPESQRCTTGQSANDRLAVGR